MKGKQGQPPQCAVKFDGSEFTMTNRDIDQNSEQDSGRGKQPQCKRPYQKPAFRYEVVFETMALACGKVQTTQAQCKVNRKNS